MENGSCSIVKIFKQIPKTYELYDILNDPYETNDLSQQYQEVFNEMKSTMDNQTIWMNPPKIDPVMMFLWGDRFTDETRFIGSPLAK